MTHCLTTFRLAQTSENVLFPLILTFILNCIFPEQMQDKEIDSFSSTSTESPEPEDISSARQDLGQLMSEQSRLRTRQLELEKKLEVIRKDAASLEEVSPKRSKLAYMCCDLAGSVRSRQH